jgi:16S rRNA (cytosine1402-N4)-methyltransferase
MSQAYAHQPVMVDEVVALLAPVPPGVLVDATVGGGGHAHALLSAHPHLRLIGLDQDVDALAAARQALAGFADRVELHHLRFDALADPDGGLPPGNGISAALFDLGVSSHQLDTPERGFSFRADGPLDMRMDRTGGPTAADLVNRLPEKELADVIYRFGEEHASRRIARAIVEARSRVHLRTTGELARIVRAAAGRARKPGLDPATLTFQALRIHVNQELEGLGEALAAIARRLAPGGRLAVIAFHSLEDREVKNTFRTLAREGFALLTKKPVRPADDELAANPRARSARLSGLERAA